MGTRLFDNLGRSRHRLEERADARRDLIARPNAERLGRVQILHGKETALEQDRHAICYALHFP